jgi:DNA helicase-2/ATP-dependent DNA helicase PcrA
MDKHPDWDIEEERLNCMLEKLKEHYSSMLSRKGEVEEMLSYSRKSYDNDNAEQYSEMEVYANSQQYFSQKVRDIEKSLSVPYFARVDFTPDDEGSLQVFYIGKITLVEDGGARILITDWRAPVSSLYYEGRIGRSGYECPEGYIAGDISLKRMYLIEKGVLLEITDIDITTNDSFLQAALGASKDKRLKDIVTTIQAEQNRVIRGNMFSPMIVQGAAGGGKTTIALHRIAYLLYEHEKRFAAHNFLIMAPNRFFLSYISGVLPDLGVENVEQTTFEDFARDFIGMNLKVNSPAALMAQTVEAGDCESPQMEAAGLKSSLKFMAVIEKYIEFIMNRCLPEEDFAVEGILIMEKSEILRMLTRDLRHLPLSKRFDELKKHLKSHLKRMKPYILQDIDTMYDDMKNELKVKMPYGEERRDAIDRLLTERDLIIKNFGRKSSNAVKAYLSRITIHDPFKYYCLLFQNENLFRHLCGDHFSPKQADLLLSATRATLEGRAVDSEDLPPMMLLKLRLHPLEHAIDARHIVIDEAQDCSMFQLMMLKLILKSDSFTLLGDVLQGIYAYRGIQSWDEAIRDVFPQKIQYLTLEQSYRTTIEIMDEANKVIQKLPKLDAPLARPVIRHGKNVKLIKANDLHEEAKALDEFIESALSNGHRSIAVICKSRRGCEALKPLMKSQAHLLSGAEKDYPGGVLILPSYLAKGLEFDSVFIADASSDNYSSAPLDAKLLYIAMTRALHELAICFAGEITCLLDDCRQNGA